MKKIIFVLAVIMMGFLPGVKVWADTTTDKTVKAYDFTDDSIDGAVLQEIPTVGKEPKDGYKAGSCSPSEPSATTVISENITYTYTYEADKSGGSGGQSEGETTSTPDPTPTTKTETDPDSPAYGKEIQGNPVVVKEGDKTTTTTTYKDGTTGVRTEETTADGTKITDEVVTAKDGSTESKRIEEAADGSKVVTEAKSDSTGANTSSTTVKTDKDGKVVETIDKSKTTSDAGVITEIEKVATSDGATTTITLTQPNGNMSTVTIKKNSEGTIIETVGHARETLEDGSVQVKDSYFTADTTTTETTITHPDGSSVEIDKVIDADDIKTETTFEKDKDGKVTGVTAEERDTDGNGVKKSFDVNEDGNLILTSVETTGDTLIIPDSVTDRQGRNYPITTLAKGSIPDVETVYIGENVNRIENGAFTDSGVKLIRFDGPVQKGMLEKDSLKGAGGKKGKGLTIYVQSKKDQKALKKQLKKAGAPKAKVKIAK